jgi:hypothetical protein
LTNTYANNEVKIYKVNGTTEELLTRNPTFGQGNTDPITIVLKSVNGNIIWDKEVAEFVKDGAKGDMGTGLTVKASRDECTEIGDCYIDSNGDL